MTTWQYRVEKHTLGDNGHVHFAISEVFSNGDKLSWTIEHKPAVGDTPDELKADLQMMLNACDLPVLERKGDTLVEVEK